MIQKLKLDKMVAQVSNANKSLKKRQDLNKSKAKVKSTIKEQVKQVSTLE